MFSSDFILYLQQFDAPWIRSFMEFISILGIIPLLLALVLGVTFGFDFRKGLVLLNILAWTSIATVSLKESIDYPRPYETDLSIQTDRTRNTSIDLADELPTGFFELFSEKLLKTTRNDEYKNHGFPSGHESTQVALWLSIILLFQKRWAYVFGISIMTLTAFSRMYLGMHFLGDILGGAVLGIFISLAILRYVKSAKFYTKRTHSFKSLSFLGFPILLIPFFAFINPMILGSILGVNAAAILQIQLMNVPVNNGFTLQRVLTALIGIFLFLFAFYLPSLFRIPIDGILGILITFVLSFSGFFGSLALCRRINLIRN